MAINALSKGFSERLVTGSRPAIGAMFKQTLDVLLEILVVFPKTEALRAKVTSFIHRMVDTLGASVFPFLPKALEQLLAESEPKELLGFLVAINYLLGKAGKTYQETVATIDLGGGSIEITYAVSDITAAKNITIGGKSYVQKKTLMGKNYNLYAYSYLNYGLLAGRAGILNLTKNSTNPCILTHYHVVYQASSPSTGSNLRSCRAYVLKYIKTDVPCKHKNCTFNGIWNGGGGAGMKNVYVASFFYDIAKEVGIIPQGATSAVVTPADFLRVAETACATKYKNIKSKFPNIEEKDIPFVCLDLIFEYTMLVNGLGKFFFHHSRISGLIYFIKFFLCIFVFHLPILFIILFPPSLLPLQKYKKKKKKKKFTLLLRNLGHREE
ncbi:hypothetical protein M9H77_17186 [Catharanthus roseus]|uniref:Uncharacterized protein n=1 Tax=Catharanthus roseus TaxID=4058 RepID=A0ACC0B3X5_CATRO|nr:hypothetical protein M9H77_17186 [Catharanthus roseus]